MQIYLQPGVESSKGVVQSISKGFQELMIKDFIEGITVHHEPNPCETTIVSEQGLLDVHYSILPASPTLAYVGRIHVNKNALLEHSMTILDIRRAIRVHVGDKAEVMSTLPDADDWVVRVRVVNSTLFPFGNCQSEDELRRLHRGITLEFCDGLIDDVRLSGMPGINTFVQPFKSANLTTNQQGDVRFLVDTEGSDLQRILASGNLVDSTRTISNNTHEIMKCFGIEATQCVIYKEAMSVLADGGGDFSFRHLWLLSHKMCFWGQAFAVTRHGMAKSSEGVLIRASFERTCDTFMEACVHGVDDRCKGVTEAIVMGRMPPVGTGFVDILKAPSPKKKEVPKKQVDEFVGRRRRKSQNENDSEGFLQSFHNFTMCPRRAFRLHNMQKKWTTRSFTPPPETNDFQTHFADHTGGDMQPFTPPMSEDDEQGPMTPPPESAILPLTPTTPVADENDDDEGSLSPRYMMSSSSDEEESMVVENNHLYEVRLPSPVMIDVNKDLRNWPIRLGSPTLLEEE